MTRLRRIVLVAAVSGAAVGVCQPAGAIDFGLGLFKKRQPVKSDVPQSRAKQLVEVLRTDPDEEKRKAAATELKALDPRNNPEIVPGLMASLQRDPSPAVRIEAAEVLGKLKPISEPAGLAMEAALESDPNPKVRESLKAALFQYHLNGYKRPDSGNPFATMTDRDKPGTTTRPSFKPGDVFVPIKNTVGKVLPPLLTPEPPLAPPKPKLPATPPLPTNTQAPTVAPPASVPETADLPKGAPRPMPSTRPAEALPVSRSPQGPTPTVTTPTVGGLPPITIPLVDVPK